MTHPWFYKRPMESTCYRVTDKCSDLNNDLFRNQALILAKLGKTRWPKGTCFAHHRNAIVMKATQNDEYLCVSRKPREYRRYKVLPLGYQSWVMHTSYNPDSSTALTFDPWQLNVILTLELPTYQVHWESLDPWLSCKQNSEDVSLTRMHINSTAIITAMSSWPKQAW